MIADLIAWQARVRPAKTAVVELATGARVSHAGLDRLAGQAAAWLGAKLGDTAGQRVAFLGRNSVALLALSLAAERAGAIFVPLNWRLAAPEIAALLADCAPALVVGDDEFATGIAARISTGDFLAAASACEPAAAAPGADPHRPIILLYTSGTTGRPKGVIVTAANAAAAALNFAFVGEVGADAVALSDLPMFHTIGLIAVARTTLSLGGTLVVSDRFQPGRTLRALGDPGLGISHYFAVPVMIEALQHDPAFAPEALARLRAIFVGGAPLAPGLVERFLDLGVPLVNGYGMSEAGTVMHVPLAREAVRAGVGTVGLPAPEMEVRLVRDGGDVAAGEVGEVWLRGPAVTPGYWQRPAETAAAFAGGWYRTGDLARREPNGFYRIVDRLKDMYVSGGENVYPAEIEAVLAAHPDIADAAVL
ncbi:MAG TPA: AMP-binding protein, partial [Devosia sp.]|nr:AMP-binding protein [Devosia sp.]